MRTKRNGPSPSPNEQAQSQSLDTTYLAELYQSNWYEIKPGQYISGQKSQDYDHIRIFKRRRHVSEVFGDVGLPSNLPSTGTLDQPQYDPKSESAVNAVIPTVEPVSKSENKEGQNPLHTKENGGKPVLPSKTHFGKTSDTNEKNRGQQPTFGKPEFSELTPLTPDPDFSDPATTPKAFSEIGSIKALHSLLKPSLVIGYDSEWFYSSDRDRIMLSWQFCALHGEHLHEYLVFSSDALLHRDRRRPLGLDHAIALILDDLDYTRPIDRRSLTGYEVIIDRDGKPKRAVYDKLSDALYYARYCYRLGDPTTDQITSETPQQNRYKTVERADVKRRAKISITVVCHAGRGDLSGLRDWAEIARNATAVQGGVVTMQPITKIIPSVAPRHISGHRTKVYVCSIKIADTMCHASAKTKSLKALGASAGVEKIQLPEGAISDMLQLLRKDPQLYAEYAANDAVICLGYVRKVYGENMSIPATLTSGAAKVVKEAFYAYFGCTSEDDYLAKVCGLRREGKGLVRREDKIGFLAASNLEPLNDKADTVMRYAAASYHGGYNACPTVGYFPIDTFDYDLQSAYPTAMALIADVDWFNPIFTEIENQKLTLSPWLIGRGMYDPCRLIFGYVTKFEFPDDVLHPCICVMDDGLPVYPRSFTGCDDGSGLHGVYCAGPELYLALRLGAKITCEKLIVLNPRVRDVDSGDTSFAMLDTMKELVKDRTLAKSLYGKKSLEELTIKTIAVSTYGKIAQNVIPKHTWSARTDAMETIGRSPITNPVAASMITSIIRAALLAAQNELASVYRFRTFSVTTDGFISDAPEATITALDLYGFRQHLAFARQELTDAGDGDTRIWEIKHHQQDLLNFCTRGNVSCDPGGVCAHNSCRSPFERDSVEDRKWLFEAVISRTDRVAYIDDQWTNFKDLTKGKGFDVRPTEKRISMDYDMKRKPDKGSFAAVQVPSPYDPSVFHEVAIFETVPFEDIDEFRKYRRTKQNCLVLRTMLDWAIFWAKLNGDQKALRRLMIQRDPTMIKDLNWAIIWTCLMLHRQIGGEYEIPALNYGKIEDKIRFINSHNDGQHKMTKDDWKNARKPERLDAALPDHLIGDKLKELQAATVI